MTLLHTALHIVWSASTFYSRRGLSDEIYELNGSMMKGKREKSRSEVNWKFLSDYFILILKGIFIPFPFGTIFCAKRIQMNPNFA
jgi:hypothetical protein